jgi:acyl phosphate:glycerol-3-phosphate acyltransferase
MFELLSLAQQQGSLWMLLAALVLGYALGSIPFGIVVTKLTGGPDLRTIGSGNIGATNVLRTGNKGLAAATLLGDALKGTLAVLVARFYGGEASALVAMLGALLGHMFPVWLAFKGGKGVATYLGAIAALDWRVGLVFIATWLLSAFIMRFSSLAALVATFCVPIAFWFFGNPIAAEFIFVLSALIWWLHRPNILRLMTGQETRIGQKI